MKCRGRLQGKKEKKGGSEDCRSYGEVHEALGHQSRVPYSR